MDEGLDLVWSALSDPTRRRLLEQLRDGPRTTSQLEAAVAGATRFAVMRHLQVLRDAGLVVVRPQGRQRWNYLNAVPLQQAYEQWMTPFVAMWSGRLTGLKHHAERLARSDSVSRDLQVVDVCQQVDVAAPAATVYEALTRDVAQWWGMPYLQGRERCQDLRLDPALGGALAETWTGGGGAVWGVVTAVEPGRRLTLDGRFAMDGALHGTVEFVLDERGADTAVTVSHTAVGPISDETRAAYQHGWLDLLHSLQAFITDGTSHGLRGGNELGLVAS